MTQMGQSANNAEKAEQPFLSWRFWKGHTEEGHLTHKTELSDKEAL